MNCPVCGTPLGNEKKRYCGYRCRSIKHSRDRTAKLVALKNTDPVAYKAYRDKANLRQQKARCSETPIGRAEFVFKGEEFQREHQAQNISRRRKTATGKAARKRQRARVDKAVQAKRVKNWRASHPEQWSAQHRAAQQRRRARIQGNGGSFSTIEWFDLCKKYDNKCLCCGEQKPLTIDHVIPLAKGGTNDIGNIQPLCHSCNSRKCAKEIDFR